MRGACRAPLAATRTPRDAAAALRGQSVCTFWLRTPAPLTRRRSPPPGADGPGRCRLRRAPRLRRRAHVHHDGPVRLRCAPTRRVACVALTRPRCAAATRRTGPWCSAAGPRTCWAARSTRTLSAFPLLRCGACAQPRSRRAPRPCASQQPHRGHQGAAQGASHGMMQKNTSWRGALTLLTSCTDQPE